MPKFTIELSADRPVYMTYVTEADDETQARAEALAYARENANVHSAWDEVDVDIDNLEIQSVTEEGATAHDDDLTGTSYSQE